jgi:hypothetical protein
LTSDVEYYYNRLGTLYNDYLQTLDNLTVSVYDVNNTYTPDANAQQELATLMYYTIANLYEFTFGTRRLRIVVVTKDTNVILLTHKYLGLDASDENIDTFIATNNIKFNELFAIKKGREIRYVK